MLACDDSFCEFYLISDYYIKTKDFHLTSYLLAISDYMGPVRGLLYGWCGQCMVYIDPYSVQLSHEPSQSQTLYQLGFENY